MRFYSFPPFTKITWEYVTALQEKENIRMNMRT